MGAGQRFVIDGIEVELVNIKRWKGSHQLPEIRNRHERERVEGVQGQLLAVEVAYTNTHPVDHGILFDPLLVDGQGHEQRNQAYNARAYIKDKAGWMDLFARETIPPYERRMSALLYPVRDADLEGSLWLLTDPGSSHQVFVVDLGPPT